MGKKDKKSLGIKTSRFFTKECNNCGYEYPNWFTNCPKCGSAWDENKREAVSQDASKLKKNVKIVVKITEEDFEFPIERVFLVFSGDRGRSWFKMRMEAQADFFLAEISEVPAGSVIIYFVEVLLENGTKYLENNEGKYFIYHVSKGLKKEEEEPTKKETKKIQKNIEKFDSQPRGYFKPTEVPKNPDQNKSFDNSHEKGIEFSSKEYNEAQPSTSRESKSNEEMTIFGRLQTEKDPDLKVCPHCDSKIKKMWSTCPICGKQVK